MSFYRMFMFWLRVGCLETSTDNCNITVHVNLFDSTRVLTLAHVTVERGWLYEYMANCHIKCRGRV